MSYHLWPIDPFWVFHGSYAITHSIGHVWPQAISCVIGPLGQFPPHQPPGLHHCFWAWGVPLSSRGFQAPWPPSLVSWPPLSLWGFGPFRPPTASTVRTPPSPQGQVGPKPQLGPPEPFLATNPLDPFLAINPVGPIFGPGPPWTNFTVMASGNHQRPPNHLNKHFPQLKGGLLHSSMHLVLKVAGVVHIWCYIPLCTIFAQQFNGDVFRTQINLLNSRYQDPTPISKENLWTHQFGNPWRQSEDHSRTPITWLSRSWAVINQPVRTWPNWANSYSTVGIQSHSFKFKMARTVLARFGQYSR
ncbi:hypothetical protein O181_029127 [Austropuccinia psidii MF-1]|uniref:Uncharacterized protein n=1 Tax=Austropuccinia psidii MF-1 TaxID=1389203 RepID=A0A9Q3CT85_9BASI|nr:hypothetical protein [Austropuccinia psidii MF-1]